MENNQEEKTIAEDLVVTKYKMAGEIVNRVMEKLIQKCVVGENVLNLCEYGDNLIIEETNSVFKKEKRMKKGIAFPTCVSINNCICHFSPLKSDSPQYLKENDVVKLDLGAHIDGFIAVIAHTVVIRTNQDNLITGRIADVYLATYNAIEAALRSIKPGKQNYEITDIIQKVAEFFNCKPIISMLSHQLKQFKIDGEKSIIQNPADAHRKGFNKCTFELHEVYALDILVSTGEGKGRETDSKTTVFKKTNDVYHLKLKNSRAFFADVDKKYGLMPFTLRSFEDENKAKIGVVECVKHHLMDPFNVLYEKDEDYVVQFKFTVLLMPSGTHKITGLPVDLSKFKSEYQIKDEDLKSLLASSLEKKKKKKSKSKNKTEAETEQPDVQENQ